MIAFLVFNATLYAGQICLYLLYFFWSSSPFFLNVIYITLAVINLAVRSALCARAAVPRSPSLGCCCAAHVVLPRCP